MDREGWIDKVRHGQRAVDERAQHGHSSHTGKGEGAARARARTGKGEGARMQLVEKLLACQVAAADGISKKLVAVRAVEHILVPLALRPLGKKDVAIGRVHLLDPNKECALQVLGDVEDEHHGHREKARPRPRAVVEDDLLRVGGHTRSQ